MILSLIKHFLVGDWGNNYLYHQRRQTGSTVHTVDEDSN